MASYYMAKNALYVLFIRIFSFITVFPSVEDSQLLLFVQAEGTGREGGVWLSVHPSKCCKHNHTRKRTPEASLTFGWLEFCWEVKATPWHHSLHINGWM